MGLLPPLQPPKHGYSPSPTHADVDAYVHHVNVLQMTPYMEEPIKLVYMVWMMQSRQAWGVLDGELLDTKGRFRDFSDSRTAAHPMFCSIVGGVGNHLKFGKFVMFMSLLWVKWDIFSSYNFHIIWETLIFQFPNLRTLPAPQKLQLYHPLGRLCPKLNNGMRGSHSIACMTDYLLLAILHKIHCIMACTQWHLLLYYHSSPFHLLRPFLPPSPTLWHHLVTSFSSFTSHFLWKATI